MSKQSPKVNPEKVQNFAEAIKSVFNENGKDLTILKTEKMPDGYYGQIKPKLLQTLIWPKEPKTFYKQNSEAIHDLLFGNQQVIPSSEIAEPGRDNTPISTIEQIVDARIELRLAEIKQSLLGQDYGIELCPARQQVHIKGKRGRTENRKSVDIASSLDEELYILFQRDKQKLGISESMVLDTILWHFYKKPKLSYELDPLRQDPPKVKK